MQPPDNQIKNAKRSGGGAKQFNDDKMTRGNHPNSRDNLKNGIRYPNHSKKSPGQPRKLVSQVINELEKLGIENVKPSQVVDLYEKFMNCTIPMLIDFSNNEAESWEVRQTAKFMIKNPEKAWNEIKDRCHGKAKQTVDTQLSGAVETTPRTIIVSSERGRAILEEIDKLANE